MWLVVNRCLAFITTSMVVLGKKLGGRPADHSAGLGVMLRALFLRSSRVRPTLLMACERLSHTWTTRRKHTRGIRGLTWEVYVLCVSAFPLDGVHRFGLL
jgi:hypothetical protein